MKKPHALIGLLAALGTAIGVLVAVVGLPYGRLNYTAFAGLYHNGGTTPALNVHFSLDCDPSTPAVIDENCTFPDTAAGREVDVILGNHSGADVNIGAFNFDVYNPSTTLLTIGTAPALNTAVFTGALICTSPPPQADTGAFGAGTTDSFLSCNNGTGPYDSVVNGTEPILSKLMYSHPVGTGVDPLTMFAVSAADDNAVPLVACDATNLPPAPPIVTPGAPCFNTTLTFEVPPPTATFTITDTPVPATATNTPLPTATFTSTATPTNTPTGSNQSKVPEGNANNVGPGPSANLYLCYPNFAPYHLGALGIPTTSYNAAQTGETCGGPGEGDLLVVEHVTGVATGSGSPIGLGAYEFSVEYDNFAIQSVNPCDIVFQPANNVVSGLGGAGAARGPVDQINTSRCPNDPGAINNGTCTMSAILENVIRFGCVTIGTANAGPTGSMDLAVLDLIPNPDLANDIFPGNNNGVLTVLKDSGCELADVFGHPVLGSVNGGLLPTCGDLAVTVRILEGDLNLDCKVNVTDEQLIAFRYGSFFGSLLYSKWFDLEPALHDLDIDIKDLQKVFGRDGSTCQNPIPAQPPLPPPFPFQG